MNPKEQEIAIGELEERVDRLRNIYEQYFLGFEKLEPTVPRKDVDRRFAILRKEQIRNTAMRFRFQVVTQKYNTYAMHWVRICRQIEEGTYKRHIRKAKARFGDTAQTPERDISIDIDIGDFEVDMDTDTADTVPPTAPTARLALETPHTSLAIAGRREVLDELEPNTPPPSLRLPERAARGAALPAGSKPRLLRKRDDNDPPASHPTMPGAQSSQRLVPEPPPTSQRALPAGAPIGPPSHRSVPGAPHSAPQLRALNPASVVRGPGPSSPGSVARIPNAAPSANRIPAGTPSAGSPAAGRIPVAMPNQTPISPFAPVGPLQGGAGAGGAPSGGRMPIAPPPSDRRMPVAPPARPPPPAPGSRPNPQPAPSSAGRAADPAGAGPKPVSNPNPRPPMPSVSDSSPPSGASGRPSARPRLPLPSQINRPTKKD